MLNMLKWFKIEYNFNIFSVTNILKNVDSVIKTQIAIIFLWKFENVYTNSI